MKAPSFVKIGNFMKDNLNRNKVFGKITEIIEQMNQEDLAILGIKFEKREDYAIKIFRRNFERI